MLKLLKALCLVFLLLFPGYYSKAQTAKVCFTDSPTSADMVIRFTDFLPRADICVWTGTTTIADVDICFVKYSTSSSIDVTLVSSPYLADYSICTAGTPLNADATIAITSRITAADVCVGIWSSPASFTKDICIRGVDADKLTIEQKVAILYCLGLLRKR